jgi:hypothetical protein
MRASDNAMKTSTSKRRVVVLLAVWALVSGAALSAPGCYGRNCEAAYSGYGTEAGQGSMIDATTWQSNPVEGAWLPFPRQQVYYFDVPALGGQTPQVFIPYLSAQREPAKSGDFTIGAGNLTLLFGPGPNRIGVKNDTCSDYYLRLVLGIPQPVDAGSDAGDASDASNASDASDASTQDASDMPDASDASDASDAGNAG